MWKSNLKPSVRADILHSSVPAIALFWRDLAGRKRGLSDPPLRWHQRIGLSLTRLLLVFSTLFFACGFTGCMERLFYVPMGVTPPPPPGIEEVTFYTSDHLRIHGWFMPAGWPNRPANVSSDELAADPPAQFPTILVLHGNAGNVADHLAFFESLPRHGFHVLIFDYRSYGKSDPGSLRREFVVKDADAALDYLLTRRDVDATRIGLWAQSLGGTFGLDLMARRTEIRSAVVMAAFTAWQDIAATTVGGDPPGSFSRWLARRLISPGMDPIETLPRITDRPILLVHGTEDSIVPYTHSQRLLVSTAPGAQVSLRPVQGAGHNDIMEVDPQLAPDIAAFFKRTLGRWNTPDDR